MSQQPIERPQLLTWGIILMAAKSVFALFLLGFFMLLTLFGFGVGLAESRGDEVFPILAIGTMVEVILFFIALLQIVSLIACRGAWKLSRFWLITLMVLSAVSVIDANVIGVAIAALVIIGGTQVIERERSESAPAQPAQSTST